MTGQEAGISAALREGARSPQAGAAGKVNETDEFLIRANSIIYACILDPNKR